MNRLIVRLAAGAGLLLSPLPAYAGLGEAGALESARANARAGGPTNDYDRDLLRRYGCLSGTQSSACNNKPQKTYTKQHRGR